jgi:hypothetical protein
MLPRDYILRRNAEGGTLAENIDTEVWGFPYRTIIPCLLLDSCIVLMGYIKSVSNLDNVLHLLCLRPFTPL